jgi:hypothetical protein
MRRNIETRKVSIRSADAAEKSRRQHGVARQGEHTSALRIWRPPARVEGICNDARPVACSKKGARGLQLDPTWGLRKAVSSIREEVW